MAIVPVSIRVRMSSTDGEFSRTSADRWQGDTAVHLIERQRAGPAGVAASSAGKPSGPLLDFVKNCGVRGRRRRLRWWRSRCLSRRRWWRRRMRRRGYYHGRRKRTFWMQPRGVCRKNRLRCNGLRRERAVRRHHRSATSAERKQAYQRENNCRRRKIARKKEFDSTKRASGDETRGRQGEYSLKRGLSTVLR